MLTYRCKTLRVLNPALIAIIDWMRKNKEQSKNHIQANKGCVDKTGHRIEVKPIVKKVALQQKEKVCNLGMLFGSQLLLDLQMDILARNVIAHNYYWYARYISFLSCSNFDKCFPAHLYS